MMQDAKGQKSKKAVGVPPNPPAKGGQDQWKSYRESAFIRLQHMIPQHMLSSLMHWVARHEHPKVKQFLIDQAIRRFEIDMAEAAQSDPNAYTSFNAFFTRQLSEGARPITTDPAGIACPTDGVVSQFGRIREDRIIQAKGQDFSVNELLGGDSSWSSKFQNGEFATIYLSPRDYHRVHAPLDAVLKRTIHVPGKLFSVNPLTTQRVPRLFARNERLCCLFDTNVGPMAVILVGAIFVSSIETVWGGELESPDQIQPYDFRPPALTFSATRGQEIGRFNMGSTVILLFGNGRVQWPDKLKRRMRVRMGQRIALAKSVS